MTATELIETLSKRGIVLSVTGGRLEVRPASALTAPDRAAIGKRLADLIAALSPAPSLSGLEPWDRAIAIQLMHDADTLVAESGLDGRHPALVAAGEVVFSAFAARDLETVRFAVAEFAVEIRRVTRERASAAAKAEKPPRTAVRPSGRFGNGQPLCQDENVLGIVSYAPETGTGRCTNPK
jgi:hypothetical protein